MNKPSLKRWLQKAREQSGLTVEQCAVAIHQPVDVYLQIEQRPGTINLNELYALMRVFDGPSCETIRNALSESLKITGGLSNVKTKGQELASVH